MGILRLILALSVVVFHSGNSLFGVQFLGGSNAVEAFYIISGFYMSMVLNEKYIGEKSSYFLFISNRLLRLYPLYILIFTITLIVYIVDYYCFDFTLNPFYLYIKHFNGFNIGEKLYLIISNLIIFGQDISLFLGFNLTKNSLFFTTNFNASEPIVASFFVIGQAWSISLELIFYAIAPFILRRKWYIIGLICIISLAIRIFLSKFYHLNYDPWTYRFFPSELLLFLGGYWSYQLYFKFVKGYTNKKNLNLIFVLLILLTLFYRNLSFEISDYQMKSVFHLMYLVLFVFALPFLFELTKKMKIDNQLGELSYPVYLIHGLVLYLLGRSSLTSVWLVSLTTIVISIILNKIVSERIEKFRIKRVLNA